MSTKLYGLKVSYFTGKLEGYLRYKEIPYTFCSMTSGDFTRRIPKLTGAMQMPAVELEDGRWMTDTSPMIDWFETEYPNPPILPADPIQAFVCRLIEDYADEWLWRPAMHYRWSYPTSSKLLRRQICDEMATDVSMPKWLIRMRIEARQHKNFVARDGVNDKTWGNVERNYLELLKILTTIFETRPFIFGETPTLADIGLFGPFFRHFAMDPVPAKIMRETAPGVMAWVYRLWNTKASEMRGGYVDGIPNDLLALLTEIGETHLENLADNNLAWANGETQFAPLIQETQYTNIPVSHYRVWCRENLQANFNAIHEPAKGELQTLLEQTRCFEPLFRAPTPASNYNGEGKIPFGNASLPVYETIVG